MVEDAVSVLFFGVKTTMSLFTRFLPYLSSLVYPQIAGESNALFPYPPPHWLLTSQLIFIFLFPHLVLRICDDLLCSNSFVCKFDRHHNLGLIGLMLWLG